MNTYKDDLDEIVAGRHRMAQFFRVALHCHSPLSRDWGRGKNADKSMNNKDNFLPDGKESE
ncbi:MAG: hypothetical protein ACYTBZ_30760, partial [Planctomycetota bacterium]